MAATRSLPRLLQAFRGGLMPYFQPLEATSAVDMLQPSTSYQVITQRWATKKAGGTARQNPDSPARNLGVKMGHNELTFPGQIIIRQRGTKYHPGYNVGIGKDHTIYSTMVGFVKFSDEATTYADGKTKERKLVSVVPINGDWSAAYKEVEQTMVERRSMIKRQMLKGKPFEAAMHFPLGTSKQQPKHGWFTQSSSKSQ